MLSWSIFVISTQFILEICVATWNRKKIHQKPPTLGSSRSFKVIHVGTPGKTVSSACYDKQHWFQPVIGISTIPLCVHCTCMFCTFMLLVAFANLK